MVVSEGGYNYYYVAGYPCLLARLRVVLHKDGVRGREVQSPDAGLSLA